MKLYETAEIEVIRFENTDIIVNSDTDTPVVGNSVFEDDTF